MNKLYLIILAGFFGLNIYAQCPNDNFFTLDITPTFDNQGSTWSGATGIWAGDYLTANVCEGATYTFTMCDNNTIYWDAAMTLYNGGGGVALAFSDDHCGLLPQITWEATFTGTVRIVIDESGCFSNLGPGMSVYCYMNSNCGTSASPVGVINDQFNNGCNADVGTFTYANNGTPVTPGSGPMVICNGNASSCYDVISNQDWIQAPAASNNPLEVSEIMHAIYTCPPPATPNPDVDACYSGFLWSGQDANFCGDAGISGAIGSNNYWLVPITADDSDNGGDPNGVINFDQDGDNCYDVGTPMEIMEVNPVSAGTVNENCYNGVISFQLNGGQSEIDGSNYVITNNANGTVVSGAVSNGGIVVVNGLNNGDAYNFTISDQAGSCPLTVSGTYTSCPCPTVDFTYTSPIQCDDGLQVFGADESGMAVGEAITPCYYIQVTPTNAQNGNTIEFFENGTSLGSLTATPNTNYSGYISPIDPSQTNTFELCETTAGLDMTYYVIDCHSGDVITSGTWVSDGTCQSVTVTPPATNMAGTSSWTGTGIIATYEFGAAVFDPSVAGPGSHNVTYNWDAGNGCSGSAMNTIVVEDAVAPTLNCPGNINDFTDPGTCTASVANPAPTYSDNCNNLTLTWALTGATTGSSAATGMNVVGTQTFNLGVTTVTYTLTDGTNTVNCSYTVTVTDNIPPTAVCQNLTVNLDASGNATITPAQIDNGSSDNCSIVNYSLDVTSFGCADVGANTVQLTVTDAAGLSDNCTATVTVVDNTAPTAVCQNLTVNLDASGNATITPAQIDNGSSDNCGIVNYSLDVSSFGCADVGANTVQLTVTDAAGLSDNCTATVTVVDNTAPTAVCQNLTVNLDASGNATITPAQIDNGSSDNCGIVNYSLDVSSFGCGDLGANTVQLTVTDAAGLSDNCTATVTVVDNTAPTAVCQNLTVNLDASGNATITPAQIDNGSSDNCGIVNYSLDVTSFGCADVGANTVQLTVTDAAGLSDNCTATVTVVDNTAPTAVCQNLTVNLDASGNATITPAQIDNGSSDNCGIVNYSLDVTSFGCGDVGANTVQLTVTDAAGLSDNCTATVTVVDPNVPIASAGSDDAICEGDTYTLSGASGGSATTGSWSSSGDGSFAPGITDPNATYTPGATDITNGSVTLTWTTDPSPCATDSESMILTINGTPTPIITGDTEYCAGNTASISTGAFSSYNWSNSATTQNTTVTVADNAVTVTVTDANGCPGTSAPYNVTENPNPQISLSPTDPSVCNATDGYITVNSVSGSTSGDISWTGTTSGSNNAVVLPNDITNLSSGNYNVTFTDVNGCFSNTASTVLNNPGAPTIDLINDTSSCEVDYVVPDPATYITGTNLTGNQAFYSASGGNAADEITQGTVITSAMSPMTIYVFDNSGTCSSEISFVVEVHENPVTTISPDPAVVCEGISLNLDGNPSGGSGTYSIHDWTGDVSILDVTNTQSPSTLTSATYGTYNLTYTVTDNNGCSGSDNITVEINETPVLSGDQEICEDETTAISTTGTPDASSPWTSSDPSIATVDASGNVLGISGGTVVITFLDANGCSSTISVDVNTKPVITLTPNDPTVCNGTDGFITVNGTGSGTVDWSGDATGTDATASLPYDIPNLEAGNYDVTFTDPLTGCESDQVSTSLNNPGAPIIDPITDTSSCEVDFVIPDPSTYITGTNLTGNQAFYSATGGNSADELTQGTVITSAMSPMTVYVFDNNGVCESETSFVVYVNENPTVSISPNPFSACTDESIQVNGNPSGGSGNYVNHEWTNTGAADLDNQTISNPIYNSSAAGNFDLTYTVEDDNGCTATETIAVTVVERTVIDAVPAIAVCGALELDSLPAITGSNLSGNENYYDDTQANGGQVVTGAITTNGTYYIYDTGGNCSNEVQVDVTINEAPQITSSLQDTAYCDYEVPGDITFTVSGQPDWNIEYTLDGLSQTVTSSQNTINLGNATGVYNITLIEDDVCSDTINEVFELLIKPSPPAPAVSEDAEYCSNEEMNSMTAQGTGGTLTWYINQFQQVIGTGEEVVPVNNLGPTIYNITETIDGCESEASQISINITECGIELSTAITPDGDGLNDTWIIPNLDASYPDNLVRIYNRWGSLIFEHNSAKNGPYNSKPWDGTTNGNALPVGSYYFVIEFNNEEEETMSGAVSIILE